MGHGYSEWLFSVLSASLLGFILYLLHRLWLDCSTQLHPGSWQQVANFTISWDIFEVYL